MDLGMYSAMGCEYILRSVVLAAVGFRPLVTGLGSLTTVVGVVTAGAVIGAGSAGSGGADSFLGGLGARVLARLGIAIGCGCAVVLILSPALQRFLRVG